MTIEVRIATLALRVARLRMVRARVVQDAQLGGPDEARLYGRAR